MIQIMSSNKNNNKECINKKEEENKDRYKEKIIKIKNKI
jgi:hypothetical protein